MKYAVIDLGSNTFHLLITSYDGNGRLNEIFRDRSFTGLSDGGIEVIKESSYQKGLECLRNFKKNLIHYQVDSVRIVGTAALRSAANRMDFINEAENILGYTIEIIDGQKEAWYIYRGITMIPETRKGNNIIVDIGGGSTELIFINDGQSEAAESFKLGIGVLADLFHHDEPFSVKARSEAAKHIRKSITSFIEKNVKQVPIDALIGASGSFEIVESLTGEEQHYGYCNFINKDKFLNVHDLIVNSNLEERLNIAGLPPERAKLSPVGLVLMKTVIDLFVPDTIIVSSYAMKEGIMREMIGDI